ncbi:MAG: endo-1,4-beta-xylanase, partial [Treponema sp.]|nr:endo-1,4-beta-xylanase [Treponema sp.]
SVSLRLVLENGSPIINQNVEIKQTGHQFLFGCGGFEAVELAGGNEDGFALEAEQSAKIQEKLDKLFSIHNFATLPFYLGRYEPEEGKPDEKRLKAAAEWYKGRGILTKGHPLCWHTVCAEWLMNYSNAKILSKVIERVEREVFAFKGKIDIWDVINEVVIMPVFDKYDNAITRVCKEIGQVKMVKEVFTAARRANPDAVLILNDFDTSVDYAVLIEKCLDVGIPIDVIGIQSHQHQGYWGAEKTHKVLERFAHFGLPLHFTENTFISGDLMPPHIVDLNDWQVDQWPSTPEGEERQANNLKEMYEILFSHSSVHAITNWSNTDDAWLHAPAGLLRTDNSVKPAYTALKELTEKKWHTELNANTDSTGGIKFEGFKGKYQVSCLGKTAEFVLDGSDEIVEAVF